MKNTLIENATKFLLKEVIEKRGWMQSRVTVDSPPLKPPYFQALVELQ